MPVHGQWLFVICVTRPGQWFVHLCRSYQVLYGCCCWPSWRSLLLSKSKLLRSWSVHSSPEFIGTVGRIGCSDWRCRTHFYISFWQVLMSFIDYILFGGFCCLSCFTSSLVGTIIFYFYPILCILEFSINVTRDDTKVQYRHTKYNITLITTTNRQRQISIRCGYVTSWES